MARGWESKSVESQIEDRERSAVPPGNRREGADLEQSVAALQLTRTRLLRELAAAPNPRFRELKSRALTHIDAQLAALKINPE